jgi:carboxypeptidase Taq
MSQDFSPAYIRLLEAYRDIDALDSAISLMSWDRQVLMPPRGSEARGAHVARLSKQRHSKFTSTEFQRLISDAKESGNSNPIEVAGIRVLERDSRSQTKLPSELVSRKSKVSSDAYEAWKIAKAENDFPRLQPYLQQLFDIAQETAELIGYTEHVYDPLVDLFEEGATFQSTSQLFEEIKKPLVDLLSEIATEGQSVDDSFLQGEWDRPKLRAFAERAASVVGFDFGKGRLDVCTNAFCTHLANSDIRMTTRPSDHVKGIVSSSLHEMGHGLYEQNSPDRFEGSPLPGGISLAVHESQSRLWENIVGRSKGFWTMFLPDLQNTFPSLAGINAGQMYRAINKVEPTFVRVGSDEVSYNLHILVRFELETEILTGQVRVKDLPDAWNSKYKEYLGIIPPSDSEGCLQDVHWSRGTIGYFPTYSMGNMISYQLWAMLEKEIGNQDDAFASGNFRPTLDWLRLKIYHEAKLLTPKDLITKATGRPMESGDFLKGIRAKYSRVYSL